MYNFDFTLCVKKFVTEADRETRKDSLRPMRAIDHEEPKIDVKFKC